MRSPISLSQSDLLTSLEHCFGVLSTYSARKGGYSRHITGKRPPCSLLWLSGDYSAALPVDNRLDQVLMCEFTEKFDEYSLLSKVPA